MIRFVLLQNNKELTLLEKHKNEVEYSTSFFLLDLVKLISKKLKHF